MYNNKGWARIGALNENHINIDGTYNGIEIFRKLDTDASPVSVAWFGSSTRIGEVADGQSRVEISSSGIEFKYRVNSSNTWNLANIEFRNAYGNHTINKSPTFTFGVRGSGSYGQYSFVVGSSNIASELLTTAFGLGTSAIEAGAFAEGWGTTASGKYSHAEGYMTTAGSDYQHVMGKCNANNSNNAFEIGNGTVSTPSNALTVDWDGNLDISGAFKSLFKVVTTTVSVPAGSAGTVATADYTLTEPSVSGYKPVAIVGISKSTYSVEPLEYWINSDTVLRVAFRRTATTTTASSIYFRVLWLKATSL
jgi:hypothetical protein